MFLESLTVISWVLFTLSAGLGVWGLVRRAAKVLLLAALPAGVFTFFFFWALHGKLFFIWPVALLAAAASLRWRARWLGWLLLATGVSTCAVVTVLMSWTPHEDADLPLVSDGAVRAGPFNPEEDARRVIAGYLQAVAAGETRVLQDYVWRYADTSAGQPPLQKGEVQGRLAAVESQGGFEAGGLHVEVYQAEMVSGNPLFFTLVQEPGDGTPRVAAISQEPVNIYARDAGPVEARRQEDAEAAVRGYFEALERQDFGGAVRWVHHAWHDFTAMPERELRSLRLLSTRFYGVHRVGQVVLMEYEVEA